MTEIPTLKQSNAPMNVIQRLSILDFLKEKQPNPEKWVEQLLRMLGMDTNRINNLTKEHMTFNELSEGHIHDDDKPNISGKPEATIYQSIEEQWKGIEEQWKGIKEEFSLPEEMKMRMQMGAVLNGISRMLAHKLGDMSATDQILDQLIKKFAPQIDMTQEPAQQPNMTQELAQLDTIKAFAKSNPILMYLHDEINSRDASIRLLEQSKLLGKNKEETYGLLERQAFMQIDAMNKLRENFIVSAACTNILYIDDPIGLYSIKFLDKAKNKEQFKDSLDKLRNAFNEIGNNPQEKYKDKNPTIAKAKHHQEHLDRDPNKPQSTVKERARRGVKACIDKATNGVYKESEPDDKIDEILNKIIAKLSTAPIMITRHAGVLLENELSEAKLHPPGQQDRAGELVAGCPPAYIKLDKLLSADKSIRYSPEQDYTGYYKQARTTAPTEDKDKYISYTPLLTKESKLAKNRLLTYPIFRSNKNRLFAGKTHQEKEAVFGTLCLAGARNYHQLSNSGKSCGTYGDVVLVFRPGTFNNYIITFGDRHRGYTNFDAFVYNAFAYKDEVEHKDPKIKSDLLIKPSSDPNLDKLLGRLIRLALVDDPDKVELKDTDSFEFIEIQIFDSVQLTRNTISEVYFAQSVKEEKAGSIMKAISQTSAPPAGGPESEDTKFFQYVEYTVGGIGIDRKNNPLLNGNKLYLKVRNNERINNNRPELSKNDLKALLDKSTVDDLKEELKNYGTHKEHIFKKRLPHFEAVFDWIIKVYNLSKADPGVQVQDLIDDKNSIRKRVFWQQETPLRNIHPFNASVPMQDTASLLNRMFLENWAWASIFPHA